MGERYIGKGWRAYRGIWRGWRGIPGGFKGLWDFPGTQQRGPKAGRPTNRETNLETSGENSLFTQINIKYILYIVYLKELISLFVRFWREFWKWVLGGGGPAWRPGTFGRQNLPSWVYSPIWVGMSRSGV